MFFATLSNNTANELVNCLWVALLLLYECNRMNWRASRATREKEERQNLIDECRILACRTKCNTLFISDRYSISISTHTHILHLNTGGGRKMENVLHLTEIPYIYEYLHMLQMQSTEFHLNFSHSGTVGIRFFFLFTRPFAYKIFFGTHKNGTKRNGMY